MRAPPGPAILTALAFVDAAYIWMGLRTGAVWLLPTLRILARRDNPRTYWAVIGAASVALIILIGILAWVLTQHGEGLS